MVSEKGSQRANVKKSSNAATMRDPVPAVTCSFNLAKRFSMNFEDERSEVLLVCSSFRS